MNKSATKDLVRCLLAALFLFTACESRDDKNKSKNKNENVTPRYGPCPDDLPGETSGRDCATTLVPLRWDTPEGEKIEVMVVRYQSESPGSGQLWLLDGGPGGTGAGYMDSEMLAIYQRFGLDLYIPQHRGTGHSTPLHCEDPGDISACGAALEAAWGDRLRGFHSDEAGRDLGFLIDEERQDESRVFVLGWSYGSYWAQRYLQAFPDQADGVMLDGVFPLWAHFWDGDPLADAAARSLFSACRDEPDCAAAFIDDPEAVAERLLGDAEDPAIRCLGADGPDRMTLWRWFIPLIANNLGNAIPGILRRLDRCSAQDRTELLTLTDFFESIDADESEEDWTYLNPALAQHVLRTDMMAEASSIPFDELAEARSSLLFLSAASFLEEIVALLDGWPVTYPKESTTISGLATPVLMTNGGLDIQTPSPWARELATELNATFVEFPFVGHGVDWSLGFLDSQGLSEGLTCSLAIKKAFIADPSATLDTTCAATAYTPDVAGHEAISKELAMMLFGSESLLGADDASAQDDPRTALSGR